MRLTFIRREELAPGIWQHFFRPDGPVRFEPGQYADVRLSSVTDDPRGSGRTFTFTSLSDEDLLAFVTKDQPQVSAYKRSLAELKPGDTATMTDPMGDLVLPKDPSVPLVFIAGGIGICSFVSMLRQLEISGERRHIQLHYRLRSREELIYEELIERFPFNNKNIYLAPERLDVSSVLSHAPDQCLYFISGSQRFVEKIQRELETAGISRQSIIFDYYDGYVDL